MAATPNPEPIPSGDIAARLAVVEEQVSRIAAELQQSEARFQAIFETAPAGMAVCRIPDGCFLKVNRKLSDITGYAITELAKLSFIDLTYPPDLKRNQELYHDLIEGRIASFRHEKRYVRKDGTLIWVAATVSLVKSATQPQHTVAVIEDITEHRQSEERLRDSERQLRDVMNVSHMGTWDWNMRTNKVLWSPGHWAIHGREPFSSNPSYETWRGFVHAEDIGAVEQEISRAQQDGSEFDFDYRSVWPNGTTHWVSARGTFHYDSDNQPWRMTGVSVDITDRKRGEAELQHANHALERANADLKQFAYAAGHDLQEPLRTIITHAQLLHRRYHGGMSGDADYLLNAVIRGGERMDAMVHGLLVYSRIVHMGTSEQTRERMSVASVMNDVAANLNSAIDETGATISCGDLPAIDADPTQFLQLLQNLVQNSIRYRRPGAPPVIHIAAESSGAEWRFSVSDNGVGFDNQYAERIFDVFKRLQNSQVPGTGVGLAICRRIVEQHGGRIWAEGRPNEGATFYFTWPTGIG